MAVTGKGGSIDEVSFFFETSLDELNKPFSYSRLENECAKLEQRHMDETAMRQNAAKMVMEKNSQVVSTQKSK